LLTAMSARFREVQRASNLGLITTSTAEFTPARCGQMFDARKGLNAKATTMFKCVSG
jgi:hypothetical protein